nr:hypothetical protein [Providencia alcalifaciens]
MTIRIEVTGYKPEITCRNNFSLAMEGYELKSLTGESSVIFGAMESPFTDVVDYAASNGMLDELIQKAIEKKGKEVAWEFQSMNSSKGRMPKDDAGSVKKKLNTIAWKA